MKAPSTTTLVAIAAAIAFAAAPRDARAHCDTADGPVVADARVAVERGDVTPALKWVRPADEGEVRAAFARTLSVRAKGSDAMELADAYFFETVVRLHRAGEGQPFDGLKPAGTPLEPGVAEADKALADGSGEALSAVVGKAAAASVRERFEHVRLARARAGDSIEAGRAYVAAYVEYVHHVARLVADAEGQPAHDAERGGGNADPRRH